MRFQLELIEAMRRGHKTQTRRVKREGERLFWARDSWYLGRQACSFRNVLACWDIPTVVILDEDGLVVRIKWQVGRRYAINPPPGPGDKGRMGKAVGSYECVWLREERLQDIIWLDVVSEGIRPPEGTDFVDCGFIELWDSLHKVGERWEENRTVWVIEMGGFEWKGSGDEKAGA